MILRRPEQIFLRLDALSWLLFGPFGGYGNPFGVVNHKTGETSDLVAGMLLGLQK